MPTDRRRAATQREAPILKGCLQLLELRGFYAWRNNVGAAKVGGRFVRFGIPGCSDILALVSGSGRLLAVETKAPGGKPTGAQWAFLESVRRAGGVAIVVSDLVAFDLALGRLQRDPAAVLTFEGLPADGPGEG